MPFVVLAVSSAVPSWFLMVQPGSVMVTPGTVEGEEEERRRTEIQ
jgi:hypothetical protein